MFYNFILLFFVLIEITASSDLLDMLYDKQGMKLHECRAYNNLVYSLPKRKTFRIKQKLKSILTTTSASTQEVTTPKPKTTSTESYSTTAHTKNVHNMINSAQIVPIIVDHEILDRIINPSATFPVILNINEDISPPETYFISKRVDREREKSSAGLYRVVVDKDNKVKIIKSPDMKRIVLNKGNKYKFIDPSRKGTKLKVAGKENKVMKPSQIFIVDKTNTYKSIRPSCPIVGADENKFKIIEPSEVYQIVSGVDSKYKIVKPSQNLPLVVKADDKFMILEELSTMVIETESTKTNGITDSMQKEYFTMKPSYISTRSREIPRTRAIQTTEATSTPADIPSQQSDIPILLVQENTEPPTEEPEDENYVEHVKLGQITCPVCNTKLKIMMDIMI